MEHHATNTPSAAPWTYRGSLALCARVRLLREALEARGARAFDVERAVMGIYNASGWRDWTPLDDGDELLFLLRLLDVVCRYLHSAYPEHGVTWWRVWTAVRLHGVAVSDAPEGSRRTAQRVLGRVDAIVTEAMRQAGVLIEDEPAPRVRVISLDIGELLEAENGGE